MPDEPKNPQEQLFMAKERTSLAIERNRLANERTFLAWIRTGLASVGGGLAVIRFMTFTHLYHEIIAKVIGGVLVVLGIALFILSSLDYRRSFKKLKIKDGHAGSVESITVIAFILGIVSVGLLLITFYAL